DSSSGIGEVELKLLSRKLELSNSNGYIAIGFHSLFCNESVEQTQAKGNDDASVAAGYIFSQVNHTHDVIICSPYIPLAIANILTRLNDGIPWIDEKWVINNGKKPRRKRSRSVPVPEEDNNATDLACAHVAQSTLGFDATKALYICNVMHVEE
nr:putative CDP-alcohol phosphatidyltransferase class-I family protein 3 [Tanacetum cinerariifolium]